jgi:hypothetical protein
MVLRILPGGDCEHLLKDGFFKPPVHGTRNVKRVSEILFCQQAQKFYIQFQDDKLKALWPNGVYTENGKTAYFMSYEDAVDKEITVIQQQKIQGISLWR